MTDDFRERMRKMLIDSYLHKHAANAESASACGCAMCRQLGIPLAFHVIENSVPEMQVETSREQGFAPMSSSGGYVKGAFPLCTTCAPPCKHCNLPTDSLQVHKFAISVGGRIGLGICTEHIQWRYVLEGLLARIFGSYRRPWTSPAMVLAKQAADMGWIVSGVDTRDGYRDTKLSRDGMLSVICHRHGNVELLVPPGPHPFKDFVELEQWFATPKGKLLKDMAQCMAEADLAPDVIEELPESPESRYYVEVSDCFREMGDRGDIALYAQLNPDFLKASFEVCMAGFKCNVPVKGVAGFIAEAAASYQSDPNVGIKLLEHTKDRIPQLWSHSS